MIFHKTPLNDARLIELERKGDDRGFFARFYCEREFGAEGWRPVSFRSTIH